MQSGSEEVVVFLRRSAPVDFLKTVVGEAPQTSRLDDSTVDFVYHGVILMRTTHLFRGLSTLAPLRVS